ncbi:MAG: hypothetical protein ACK4YO_02940, partial [Candidatus Altarchaeaceae archaeon]
MKNLVFAKKGREKLYNYYKKRKIENYSIGCIDEILLLNDFKEILNY